MIENDEVEPDLLERTECFRLLGTTNLGRVGLTLQGLPWVVPVRYVVDGSRILFRTGPDPRFARAVRDAVVAFETDHGDTGSDTTWSVMATGIAREVCAPSQEDPTTALGHFADGQPVLVIEPEIISGWRQAADR